MEDRQRPSRADSLRLTRMPGARPRSRPPVAPPPPAPPPPGPARKSRKGWWVGVGLVVALVAAGGLVIAYRATTDATIPDRGVPPVAIPTETVAATGPAPVAPSRPAAVAPVASAPAASRVPTPSPSVVVKPAPPKVTAQANPSRVNLALAASVTASSTEGDAWPARDAADGDPDSRWSSGFAEPQWLRADLGRRRVVSEVTVVWEHAYAIGYRVDVSLDGQKWRTVFSTTAGEGGAVRIDTDGVTARYVRMYGTKRSNRYGFSIYEFEIR